MKKVSIDTMIYKRSSYKELNSKIKQAKDAVLRNRISILKPASVAADALELGYLVKDVLNPNSSPLSGQASDWVARPI